MVMLSFTDRQFTIPCRFRSSGSNPMPCRIASIDEDRESSLPSRTTCLLYTSGSGFERVLREAMEAEKTIVMTTQVQNEGSNLSVYDVGFHLKNDLHLLEAYDMTTEAVVAKLMWILGQTRDPAEIRRLFCTPVSYDLLYLKREDKA